VRTAAECRVGVLGLGSLGQAVLTQLVALGFDVAGWSRSHRDLPGVHCHAGDDEIDAFLARNDRTLRIGGWRSYARQAQEPQPASEATSAPAGVSGSPPPTPAHRHHKPSPGAAR
jgi:hypothetical protein